MTTEQLTSTQSANRLDQQKKHSKRIFIDYLLSSIIFTVLLILAYVVRSPADESKDFKIILSVAMSIVWGIDIFLFCISIVHFIIFGKLKRISNLAMQTTKINCKRARLLVIQVGKHQSAIAGVVFIDENNQKYYYVLTTQLDIKKGKNIKRKCRNAKISLDCYVGTNMVQSSKSLRTILTTP